jgi:argininosuccinate synthase
LLHVSLTILRCSLLQDELMPRYAELVYNGFWFSPERRALQAAIDETQKFCTGTVRLKLYKVRTSGSLFPL